MRGKSKGIQIDDHFTTIDTSCTWYHDDQFTMAIQARQVYYLKDPKIYTSDGDDNIRNAPRSSVYQEPDIANNIPIVDEPSLVEVEELIRNDIPLELVEGIEIDSATIAPAPEEEYDSMLDPDNEYELGQFSESSQSAASDSNGICKAFYRNLSEKKQPWLVPVLNIVGRREGSTNEDDSLEVKNETGHVQWALGKAGEDRVHVVVSEDQGWLFVGIHDGFNGPDAPEFLMGNLYRAVYNELQGLFWEIEEEAEEGSNIINQDINNSSSTNVDLDNSYEKPLNVALVSNPSMENSGGEIENRIGGNRNDLNLESDPISVDRGSAKHVTFQSDGTEVRRRRLWEFLAEDDALSVSNAGFAVSRRWLLLSKLKQGLSKHKEGHGRKLFTWKYGEMFPRV
ncbi:Protein phosphatase 2C 29 [Morella rubra]|uniref:Protein phosphatase 2C 29 n=1 Tax=Morella rubra TaxID=262757 RepID=A0A6A1WDY5_9ROSI|nr:Protein phosphatase 2C 29 [Morella rubra]